MTLIYTNDRCIGCNKCIRACSCTGANVSVVRDGKKRIEVDGEKCIACGACFDVCQHQARSFSDDSEQFFEDLKNGEQISVLIAPSFKANYPRTYESVLGGLKQAGVNHIVSVSFGADITTWGYLNSIKEDLFIGGISQPCPSVVGYIERYIPELIPKLFPVQSPMMCSAIYLKKYKSVTDKLAFIGPCVAKKLEIDDPVNGGYISYNITFDHLMRYVQAHGISGPACADELEYGLGAVYPMPGGLRENIQWFLGDDALIRQVEGENSMYRYLNKNRERIADSKIPYLMVDALNCESGCLSGSGCETLRSQDDNIRNLYQIRQKSRQKDMGDAWDRRLSPRQRLDLLNKQFAHLNPQDFKRVYTDRSAQCRQLIPTREQLEDIFQDMEKYSDSERCIDCSCCGYSTCREMAVAIYNGFSHRENCIYYLKRQAEHGREKALALALEEMERRRLAAQLEKVSYSDMLTGVGNRNQYIKVVDEMKQNPPEKIGIVYADVNGLKRANDTYGYEQGDHILKKAASILKQDLDGNLFRIGGDEFVSFHIGITRQEFEDRVALLRKHLQDEHDFGIAVGTQFQEGQSNPDQLIIKANGMMYIDKQNYYRNLTEGRQSHRSGAARQLIEEIESGRFMVYLQPKVDLKDRRIIGAEALVRKTDKNGDIIPPDKFIPIYETDGIIRYVDFFVLQTVCSLLEKWKPLGIAIPIAVNLSRITLLEFDVVGSIREVLRQHDTPPHLIRLEITESVSRIDSALFLRIADSFRREGFTLSLDDFGTQYSNLSILTEFDFDEVKFDKSLVQHLGENEKSDIVLSHVVDMCRSFPKTVSVAEGIETREQEAILKGYHCEYGQGYLFSRPVCVEDFMEMYLRQRP